MENVIVGLLLLFVMLGILLPASIMLWYMLIKEVCKGDG
jgi:hypothetical protein